MHARAATIIGAVSVAAIIGTGALVSSGQNRPNAPTTNQESHLAWGIYQILWSRDYGQELTNTVGAFTTKPNYVMFYRDLMRPFPKFAIDCIDRHDATAIVSLELWSWHGGRAQRYLPAINQGDHDEAFRRWARDAKADGRRVLLRFGFEFNGDWFTWSGKPAAYIEAWRRIHRIFREVGARNVEWVWSPNVVSCPDTPENDMHQYYPGDDFVDWIGVDGYNFGDHHDEWHDWTSFEGVFGGTLRDLAKRYPSKPQMIAEFGSAPGKPGAQAAWIRDAHRALRDHALVKAVIWFNYDKRRENEPNWRIDNVPDALRAFNETFAAPRATPR